MLNTLVTSPVKQISKPVVTSTFGPTIKDLYALLPLYFQEWETRDLRPHIILEIPLDNGEILRLCPGFPFE